MIQKLSTRDGYGKGIAESGNGQIVVLTADLAESCRVKDFAKNHPERFFQAGISEQDMIGLASGMALEGFIPFTNTFAAFCLRAVEQARIIAINNSNVKIVGHHSGISLGQDGVSQMCENDIAVFRSLPNFFVVVPCDAIEAQKAVNALAQIDGPCYLRLSREPSTVITNEFSDFKIGRANLLKDGEDVIIVSCGMMVSESLKAANLLQDMNINAAVMNMHTIKPLDKDALIKYVGKIRAVVTVEEHSIYGGLGGAVAECLSQSRIPLKIIGINDVFGESGSCEELFIKNGLTARNIADACISVIKLKEHHGPASSHVREVNDIVKEINGKSAATENNISSNVTENNRSPNNSDPRNRIVRINTHDKKKVDDVLFRMFGGRKNG
jgi:transketolase